MHQRYRLLGLLADGLAHSGEALGHVLGISRTAVWKHIAALGSLGLTIEARRGRGYRWVHATDLLDAERIRQSLAGAAAGIVGDIDVLTEVGSTNAEMLARRLDEARCSVCLAEYQTAGRGRRGRSWLAPFAGSINLSLAWQFDPPPVSLSGLSLAAGVAVVRALVAQGVAGVGLKWPNDIVCADKKLGGILIELAGETGGPCRVVIGIGINVCLAGADSVPDQPWVDLAALDVSIERNALAGAVISHLVDVIKLYEQSGFAPLKTEWSELDQYRGKPVRLVLPEGEVAGVATGVADDGALLLDTPAGEQRFIGGEISLRARI